MMDETFLMDMVKEQLCFVSQDVKSDLRAAQVGLAYTNRLHGRSSGAVVEQGGSPAPHGIVSALCPGCMAHRNA